MNIIYILKSFAQLAGTERVMADKINYLANHNYHITLVTYEQGNHPLAFPLHPSVTHIDIDTRFFTISRFPLYTRIFHYIILKRTFQKRLHNITKKEMPNYTITTTYSIKVAKEILKTRENSKTIMESHISHNSILRQFDYNRRSILRLFAMLYDWYNMKIIQQFDIFVALTNKDASQWNKYLRSALVIPNPLTKYPDKIEIDPPTKHRIIAVGRLNHQKGFDKLISAFSLISEKYPLWHIDIFGDGELYHVLCDLIEKNRLKGKITINQPTNNIYQEYLNSDFYVLSSNFEGFGLVLIEAMACGLPCVAFDCPYGPDEIISNEKNGLLVEKGNIKQLAEKMEWMITNESKRKHMAKQARKDARKYKIEHIMPIWEGILQKHLK